MSYWVGRAHREEGSARPSSSMRRSILRNAERTGSRECCRFHWGGGGIRFSEGSRETKMCPSTYGNFISRRRSPAICGLISFVASGTSAI